MRFTKMFKFAQYFVIFNFSITFGCKKTFFFKGDKIQISLIQAALTIE